MIASLFAQMDFRIPISFVLSATEANITFMIPIPDTINTIVAIPISKMLRVFAFSCAATTLLQASITLIPF